MDMSKWNQPLKRKYQVFLRAESTGTFLFCVVLVDSWQREQEPEKRESIKKVRNPFRKPTSFRFSGYRKSETISLSDAKKELRNLYPRIANVSFLCSRVNNVLHGWVNFKYPFDCSQTYDEIQTLDPLELKLSPVESCFDAEFAHNLKPLPPIFVAKKEGPKNFTKKYRRKFFEKALK